MIHLHSRVVVCNYLLVILQQNDVVNVSAECLFNTGNLITALGFCLFGFLTPFSQCTATTRQVVVVVVGVQ